MRSVLHFRSIPADISGLMGVWGWATTNEEQYILKIIAADAEIWCKEKTWCIKDGAGNILARINGRLLCEWLELDVLMTLSPLVSLRAACIALISRNLDEFLNPSRCGQISIEESSCAAVEGDCISVEMILHREESPLYATRSLHLGLSRQVLLQHMRLKTLQKNPIAFDPDPNELKGLSNEFCIEIGSISLSIEEIALLERGCLLLLSKTHAENTTIRLKSKSIDVDIQESAEHGKWKVTAVRQTESDHADRQEFLSHANKSFGNSSMHIDDIPVDIKIQLAQAKVKFMNLKQLEVGSFVTLETPDELKVNIIFNGVSIAQGCLVELDGNLAVEVQSIRNTL